MGRFWFGEKMIKVSFFWNTFFEKKQFSQKKSSFFCMEIFCENYFFKIFGRLSWKLFFGIFFLEYFFQKLTFIFENFKHFWNNFWTFLKHFFIILFTFFIRTFFSKEQVFVVLFKILPILFQNLTEFLWEFVMWKMRLNFFWIFFFEKI